MSTLRREKEGPNPETLGIEPQPCENLRLDRHWPWANQLATAFARLQTLGAPRAT
jgi:hypothetical protein